MKRYISMVLSAVALAVALLLTGPVVRVSANPAAFPQERREGFEDLRRAEDALRAAREYLVRAPGEYGGHRDKAIKRIDEALAEVHESFEHH